MRSLKGRTALITGASAGIGREIARVLAGEVARLILVARRRPRLDELAAEISAAHPELRIDVRPADLASKDATSDLIDALEREGIAVDVLINNAGFGEYGPFAETDWARTAEMIEVNVAAPTHLLKRLLPPMIQRGFGAILNVGSSAGSAPSPSLAVYSATKAYLNHLNEALAAELSGTGVTTTALMPGPVETEFQEVAGSRPPLPRAFYVDAKDVAEQGVRGMKQGRTRVVPGAAMHAAVLAAEALPKAMLRPFLRQYVKKLRQPGG